MGVGTPEVESLTGYIARLAEAHSVTVADLVGAELSDGASSAPLLPPRPHRKSFNVFYTQPYSVNGVGEKTKRWCFVLEKATLRNDLSRLTLLAFEPLLSQISLFRRRCAWCPGCLEERRCPGGTVYESLLWTMELVRLCPNHCRFLEEICRRCQRSSGPLAAYSRPGYCSRCGDWLGRRHGGDSLRKQLSQPELDYEIWVARNIGELLAAGPQLEGVALLDRLRRNLSSYIEAVSRGNLLAFGHITATSRSVLRGWTSGKHRPELRSILRLCYQLRSPLVRLLQEAEGVDGVGHLQDNRGVRHLHRTDQVRLALKQALSDDSAPALTEVARRLNYVRTGWLYQIDRECCRKITARHRAASRISQGEGQTANQRICAKAKIRKKLEHSLAQERPVSVNHIAQSLGYVNGGPFRLEFPELCRAIGKKQAALKRGRLRDAERVLRVALEEDPPPSPPELSKRLEYASPNVLRHNFPELYATLLARRAAYQAECRRKIYAYLLGILARDSAPQVLEVCEKIRLSPSRAYVCYPELCHAIAAKHRQFEKALRVQRRARLRDEVFRVVSKLYEHGEYPSYSRVQATLNVDSLGDSRSIREFVQEAKQELNVRFPYSDSEGIPR
jgi:hypothetical protein